MCKTSTKLSQSHANNLLQNKDQYYLKNSTIGLQQPSQWARGSDGNGEVQLGIYLLPTHLDLVDPGLFGIWLGMGINFVSNLRMG